MNHFSKRDLDRLLVETFVKQIDFHDEIASTNDRAMSLCRETPVIPTIVLAARQTAGRGRGANMWWSDDGSLTFSLILDATLIGAPVQKRPQVSLVAAVALAKAFQSIAPTASVGIKWPNDVFMEARKIAGILTEVPPSQDGLFVMGIGANINNSIQRAPREIAANSTSLTDTLGEPIRLPDVMTKILDQLSDVFHALSNEAPSLCEEWRRLCILRNRQVIVHLDGQTLTGLCLGIDDQGWLQIQSGQQKIRCQSGSVELVQ
jgi:BirA family transcriptional regulator, biotin operon repressor / biotin---[acetyl-CoA-carboxylase] ligase